MIDVMTHHNGTKKLSNAKKVPFRLRMLFVYYVVTYIYERLMTGLSYRERVGLIWEAYKNTGELPQSVA